MEIFNYHNGKLSATPAEVFGVVNDDEALKQLFGIIEDIEYQGDKRRETGTKFRTILNVMKKTYRFRSEITDYVAERRVEVRSRFKQGDVITQFTVVPVGDDSEVTVRSTLRNSKKGAVAVVMAAKPIISRVMNREMKKFERRVMSD